MKKLKSLNKIFNRIFFITLVTFSFQVSSNEPIDIWNLDQKKEQEKKILKNSENIKIEESQIYKKNIETQTSSSIFEDNEINKKVIQLAGLYDPEENDLTIDMWHRSDGDQIKNIFNKINKINLSNDAKQILEIALFTNSYFPDKNITENEFLKFKVDYLINNNDLEMINEFIRKNINIDTDYYSEILTHYTNQYLSVTDIKNACSIFNDIKKINNNYLTKFKIYCLVYNDKKDEAQLLFDLKKELGFKDKFFEKKFNLLMGYELENEKIISDKSILNFHLSHITNSEFEYQPDQKTSNLIWKYLSSSNLLDNVETVSLEDIEKIKIIEKATHENNYSEKDLLNLYKRFQFNINQLINALDVYKALPNYEGRALLYQKLLLTKDLEEILEISSILKQLFNEDQIPNAFKDELNKILQNIKFEEIPSNYTTFYKKNLILDESQSKKIKINNKFIHQSKLLNYFQNEKNINKIEKELNEILKKTKKNKKYYISTKDIILIESLKSDGVKISKKYQNLYDFNPNVPIDIQVLINNEEPGMTLLRIVEILGEDNLNDLGTETLSFIVDCFNQLNIDKVRNEILLKVLPLKV